MSQDQIKEALRLADVLDLEGNRPMGTTAMISALDARKAADFLRTLAAPAAPQAEPSEEEAQHNGNTIYWALYHIRRGTPRQAEILLQELLDCAKGKKAEPDPSTKGLA